MITVFYDGKCGLCRREIEYYIRIAPRGVFEWVDITVAPHSFTIFGFTVKDGLKALHVRDDTGVFHVGVDGFVIIWQKLPRWRTLAWALRLPIIRPVAQWLYTVFSGWRFKKRGYDSCDL